MTDFLAALAGIPAMMTDALLGMFTGFAAKLPAFFHPFESCPWDNCCPATFNYLEENLCGWVKEPSNTWSNMAFVIVGLILLWQGRKERWSPVKFIPLIAIALGLTSGMYHASCIFFFQVMDLGSMFLIALLLLTFNLRRLGIVYRARIYYFYWIVLFTCLALLIQFHKFGQLTFFVMSLGVVVTEIILALRGRENVTRKPMVQGVLFLLFGWSIWHLDKHSFLTTPYNHIFQWHALWHVFCAMAIYSMHQFYDQFDFLSARREIAKHRVSDTIIEYLEKEKRHLIRHAVHVRRQAGISRIIPRHRDIEKGMDITIERIRTKLEKERDEEPGKATI